MHTYIQFDHNYSMWFKRLLLLLLTAYNVDIHTYAQNDQTIHVPCGSRVFQGTVMIFLLTGGRTDRRTHTAIIVHTEGSSNCPEINKFCSVLFSRRVHAGQYCNSFFVRDKNACRIVQHAKSWEK